MLLFSRYICFSECSFDRPRAVDCNAGNRNATRTAFSIYATQTAGSDHDVHDNKIAIARSDRPESMFACNQIPPFDDGNCDGKTNFELFDEMVVHMYRENARDYGIHETCKRRVNRFCDNTISPPIIVVLMFNYKCVLSRADN